MEAAEQSGDPAATGKAIGDMLGALSGANGTSIPAQDMKALMPATLTGMPRQSIDTHSSGTVGLGGSGVRASYAAGDKRVELSITDAGSVGRTLMNLAGIAAIGESETNTTIEKIYKQGGRTIQETSRKDGSRSEVKVVFGNGIMVEATGQHMDINTLRKMLDEVDLSKIESIKRPEKS